jgi:hypothetical protein
MDGAGDEFLAGAAFAADEHAGIARGHQSDALEDILHRRTSADDLFGFGDSVRGRGLGRWPTQQSVMDTLQRLLQVERLGQVIESSALDRTHRRRQIAKRCHDDDRQVGHELAKTRQRRQAIHAGQMDIKEEDIGPLLVRQREGLFGGSGHGNGVAVAAQSALERPAHRFFIVYNQDVFHRLTKSRSSFSREP